MTRSGELPGEPERSTFDLAYATLRSGDVDAAAQIARQGRSAIVERLDGQSPSAHDLLLLAQLDVIAGDRTAARSRLAEVTAAGVGSPTDLMHVAELHALLGDGDRSIETLAEALEAGYQDRFFPRVLPALTTIRDDPRFEALITPPGYASS